MSEWALDQHADPFDKVIDKCRADIKREGWSAISVFGTEENPRQCFTYSVGFTEFGHPELVVTTIKVEQMYGVLYDAYQALRKGHRFQDGDRTDVLCAAPYTFGILAVPGDGQPANVARCIYGDIPLLQAVWPDRDNNMPWEDGWGMDPQFILDEEAVEMLGEEQ